ncbi:MAG TPA: NADPH:quinone oxidoreductase family protein, partial [Deltaproteobacteria bacterium]|nr:NADPH:quinone oxidoreductase family protein [Deltaproteobacteria bacterium]
GEYAFSPPLPFTQGQEVVGRILDWGEGVAGRKVGDRVMAVTSFVSGNGGFAEECLVLDDFCLDAPHDLDDTRAAGFLIPFHTALLALERRGRLERGETLLVLGGAGGTGSAAIGVGRALGARVIATAGGEGKADFCRSLGADRVIDHRSEDIAESVMADTGGRGVDVVFDPVGGAAFTSASRCIAPEGRILAVGFASGEWGRVDTAHLVNHNYSVLGVIPTGYVPAMREEMQQRLLGWWRTGRLELPVHELVSFEALPSALERLLAGDVLGKLSLAVGTSKSGSEPIRNGIPAP